MLQDHSIIEKTMIYCYETLFSCVQIIIFHIRISHVVDFKNHSQNALGPFYHRENHDLLLRDIIFMCFDYHFSHKVFHVVEFRNHSQNALGPFCYRENHALSCRDIIFMCLDYHFSHKGFSHRTLRKSQLEGSRSSLSQRKP